MQFDDATFSMFLHTRVHRLMSIQPLSVILAVVVKIFSWLPNDDNGYILRTIRHDKWAKRDFSHFLCLDYIMFTLSLNNGKKACFNCYKKGYENKESNVLKWEKIHLYHELNFSWVLQGKTNGLNVISYISSTTE